MTMNRNFAKLVGGQPVWAPDLLREEDRTIANPSAARLAAAGYKPVVREPHPEAADRTFCETYAEEEACIRVGWVQTADDAAPARSYEQRVEELIRARYTPSDELAILRQRYTKPGEFDEYFAFCEACKTRAKEAASDI